MIKATNLHRSYSIAKKQIEVLHGLDLHICRGETVFLCGPSGAGKTTLMYTLAGLEPPQQGQVIVDGEDVYALSLRRRALFRNKMMGFIFQNYNLLAKTTAVENVELPLMYNQNYNARQRREAAIKALQQVGLGDRLEHKSNQMSGGQMQRVAIARALVNNPAVILADEATGNLDTRTSFEILCLFQELHRKGCTIIFVTHNPEIAQYSSRNIMLRDGRICSDEENNNILSAKEALDALPLPQDD
ncbi:MAG: ABC transporter ATP-binding protein [Bacteroidaceae bacterium]|nr:ABC transporter ATP-binding protein [Bacteroidaceae bacterium]